MPYFMDRHDLEGTTAEDIAKAHLQDLNLQQKYGVKYLSYWFDYERQAAFCLVDSPSPELAERVHAESHGLVANEIIPVDEAMVEAFLGRMEDPTQSEPDTSSAFRVIFFSDIEGSTAMTQRIGDDAAVRLLGVHDEVVRTALGTHDGREVKHTGDGIMASFVSVTRALGCSVVVQHGLAEHTAANPDRPLRVRIGLGAGEPVAQDNDLFGAAVQLSSRLCDHGEAGEIVVSGVVREMAIGKNFDFTDLEDINLKGFPEPVRVCRVRWQN